MQIQSQPFWTPQFFSRFSGWLLLRSLQVWIINDPLMLTFLSQHGRLWPNLCCYLPASSYLDTQLRDMFCLELPRRRKSQEFTTPSLVSGHLLFPLFSWSPYFLLVTKPALYSTNQFWLITLLLRLFCLVF